MKSPALAGAPGVLFLCAAFLVPVGCRQGNASPPPALRPLPVSVSTGEVRLEGPVEGDSMPGIDDAYLVYGTWEGRVLFVLWADTAAADAFRATAKGSRFVEYQVYLDPGNGSAIDACCRSEDGESGTLTIGKRDYVLAAGRVFLVSTLGKTFEVRQLPRDLEGFDPAPASFERMAREDGGLRDYFRHRATGE